MTRLTLATLACVALCSLVAWSLGGRLGAGVLAGGLLATAVACGGVSMQKHLARFHPERVMRASLQTFLAKLALCLVGVLCLRFIEPLGARFDWQAFLVAFPSAALWVSVLGSFDVLHTLKQERAA